MSDPESAFQECPRCQLMQHTLYADGHMSDDWPVGVCAWCLRDLERERSAANERNRVVALAHAAECEGIALTAAWLEAAAHLVVQLGPLDMTAERGDKTTTLTVTQPVSFRDVRDAE